MSVRIISDLAEIKRIIGCNRVVLNRCEEDPEYTMIQNYNRVKESWIKLDKIYEAYKVPIVFIPNIMGNLVRDKNNNFINPTKLWMKYEYISKWIESGLFVNEQDFIKINNDADFENLIKQGQNLFFNEQHLIMIQRDSEFPFIHWKMMAKAIEHLNKIQFDIFDKNFKDKKIFGINMDKLPTFSDKVKYAKEQGLYGSPYPYITPSYITVLIPFKEIKKVLNTYKPGEIYIPENLESILKSN
jgi:hypothetical protein